MNQGVEGGNTARKMVVPAWKELHVLCEMLNITIALLPFSHGLHHIIDHTDGTICYRVCACKQLQ